PLCGLDVRDGERPGRARRRSEDHQRERGHQGVLPGPLGRGAAQELPERQALQASQAVAVVSDQLSIAEVSKSFGGVQAVTRVSLDVRQGEIMSVIGPNGAGKTTVLNMISGFYHPDAGRILFEDTDISTFPASRVAALGFARTFQNIALFKGMTVLDNLMLGRHVHMKAGVLKSFVYWGLAQKEEVAHRRRVEDIIDFLKIQDLRRRPTGSLAYGLQKRVELGRALAPDAGVLLLDERMGGCNHEEKEDMARFILEIGR